MLVPDNGSYCKRIVRILGYLGREAVVLAHGEQEPADPARIDAALTADPSITHVAQVHCETGTGILNPLPEIAAIVAKHGRGLIVDAMSSYGAIPIDAGTIRFDALIAASGKCLEGVPGMGFVIARRAALERSAGNSASLAMDLLDQWQYMQKTGQWRFTPPTHVLAALRAAIDQYQAQGGLPARLARYTENCAALVSGMRALGFKTFLPDALQAPIIVTFHAPPDPAYDFTRVLSPGARARIHSVSGQVDGRGYIPRGLHRRDRRRRHEAGGGRRCRSHARNEGAAHCTRLRRGAVHRTRADRKLAEFRNPRNSAGELSALARQASASCHRIVICTRLDVLHCTAPNRTGADMPQSPAPWLQKASPAVFTLFASLAGFATYFSMYAFRKPFAAASFDHIPGLALRPGFQDNDRHRPGDGLRRLQVHRHQGHRRNALRGASRRDPRVDRGCRGLRWSCSRSRRPAWKVAAMFLNGLCLGMIWGLVFFVHGGPALLRDPWRSAVRELHRLLRGGEIRGIAPDEPPSGGADVLDAGGHRPRCSRPLLFLGVWGLVLASSAERATMNARACGARP